MMKNKPICTLIVLLPLFFLQCDRGWRALFDGRSLDGWEVKCTAKDRDLEVWRVRDGLLSCDSMGNPDHDYVWLMSEGEFSDFELLLIFRAFRDSPGNSGVQIRSRYDANPSAPRGGWMDGPQVDIHPPLPWRTGLLYDETREVRRWISPSLPDWRIEQSHAPASWRFVYADQGDGWNELRVFCRNLRITARLNGLLMSDFDGRGVLDDSAHLKRRVGRSGHIALQLHANDELRIDFKEIRIREFAKE